MHTVMHIAPLTHTPGAMTEWAPRLFERLAIAVQEGPHPHPHPQGAPLSSADVRVKHAHAPRARGEEAQEDAATEGAPDQLERVRQFKCL